MSRTDTSAVARAAGEEHADHRSVGAILNAALEQFSRQGYGGTSVREIAAGAGISVPGLYHHFASKHEVLLAIMRRVMADLIAATATAVAGAPARPEARLRAAVGSHVRFHAERRAESFVGNSELRSLDEAARREIVGLRDKHQRLFDRVVCEGVEAGVFRVSEPLEASRAIVTMSTAVANWYSPEGELSPQEIADRYCELALALVGADAARPAEESWR
jgi:AcrR family transcriptional regulator